MKECPYCTKPITQRRLTCGSDACREADAAAFFEKRRQRRMARPKPTVRVVFGKAYRIQFHEERGWRCYICEYDIDPTAVYPSIGAAVIDHIVPLSQGGTNEESNLGSAHSYCNMAKGRRALSEAF